MPRVRCSRIWLPSLSVLCVLAVVLFAPAPAQSQSPNMPADVCTPPIAPVPTPANPTTVTTCTAAGLQAALDNGGHIVFDCGSAPTTIALSEPLRTNGGDTVLDGGDLVTLDGQGQTKILENLFSPNPRTVVLQNLTFINGRAPDSEDLATNSGAAITSGSPGTRLHIINSVFRDNRTTSVTRADNQGGAIFSNNSFETIIVGSVFENNRAGNGGAIGGLATGMLIYNSRFVGNQAVDDTAGGIVRGYGGALHLDGVTNRFNPDSRKELTVCGSWFENNSAIRGGGAIGSVVSDNRGTKATFDRSTFIGNSVAGRDGEGGQGGALYHIEDDQEGAIGEDNFELRDSTFTGNTALRQGGAAWLLFLGRGTIVNTTFEGNRTSAPFNTVGQGGALSVNLGLLDIVNSTFANNHAAYQGGALHGGGANNPQRAITLRNSLFVNNTLNEQDQPSETRWQGYHTNRPMADGGNNIQFPRLKPTYENDVNNNITASPIYVDPLLQPLADNGGATQTMALGTDSPAINAGSGNCPATDQRGATRDSQCDIGAFEFAAMPPVTDGPLLAGITPALVEAGAAATTFTAGGENFSAGSTVRLNGADLPTTFVSDTQLTFVLDTARLEAPATLTLTVFDPDAPADVNETEARTVRVVAVRFSLYLPIIAR